MGYKYYCTNCGGELITEYLKIGEIAVCRNCGSKVVVPENAVEVSEKSSIIKQVTTHHSLFIESDKWDDEEAIPRFSELLSQSWSTIKSNFDVAIGAAVIYLALNAILSSIQSSVKIKWPENTTIFIITLILTSIGSSMVRSGLLNIALSFAFKNKAIIQEFKLSFRKYAKIIVGEILYLLLIVLGLTMLIIPGIIIAIRYQFYIFFIIKYDAGIIESFEQSAELTKGLSFNIFTFNIAMISFGLLGILGCIVGLYITIPISLACWALLFSRLIEEKKFEDKIPGVKTYQRNGRGLRLFVFRADDDYPKIGEAIILILLHLVIGIFLYYPLSLIELFVDFSLTDYIPLKITLEIVSISLIIWFVVKKAKISVKDIIPLKRFNPIILLPISIGIFGIEIISSEINNILDIFLTKPEWFKEFIEGLSSSYAGFIVMAVIMAPIVEEVFFRGIIVRGFAANYSKLSAIVISALLFGIVHFNPWQGFGAFLGGLILAWIYIETESIIPCIYAHAFYNGFISILLRFTDLDIPGFSSALPSGQFLQPLWFDLLGLGLIVVGVFGLVIVFRVQNSTKREVSFK